VTNRHLLWTLSRPEAALKDHLWQAQRKKGYQKLQTILAEDQPMAFLVFCNYVYAINDRITEIVPRNAPHGQGNNGGISGEVWWNAEQWQKE